jgi:hypothetical protein
MSGLHDNDREIEEFLTQSRSPLVDLYRKLPQPQPDAPLDQRILQQARQALADNTGALSPIAKKPAPRYKPSRWPIALASAASVVFAATLALHFSNESWQAQDHAPAAASATSANDVIHVRSIDLPAGKSVVSDSLPAPVQPSASATNTQSGDTATMNSATYAPKKTLLVSRPMSDAAAPLPALGDSGSNLAAKPKLEAVEITGANIPRADAQNAAPLATLESEHEAARQRTLLAAPSSKKQTRDERDAIERKLDIATGRDAALRARNNIEPARPHVADAIQHPSPPVAAAAATPIDPDAWLANIRAQLQAGKRDEAVRNLKLFHDKYPNYELTPDLRQLLP